MNAADLMKRRLDQFPPNRYPRFWGICLGCKKQFYKRGNLTRATCSNKCRQKAYRERKALQLSSSAEPRVCNAGIDKFGNKRRGGAK